MDKPHKKCVKERKASQKQTGKGKQATMSKFVAVTPAFDYPSSSEVTTANNQEQSGKCCLDAPSTSLRNASADNDEQSCSKEDMSTIANDSSDNEQQDFWLAPPVQVTQEGM